MKVSVLIPVYGVEKYIERCAVSLFEQTYDDIEFVFIDDCSIDQSIKILKTTILRYPQRANQIKLIRHEKNMGLGVARNTAVEHATGEFVLHVDSDDYIATNAIERLVQEQKKDDADIVSGNAVVLRPSYTERRHLYKFKTSRDLTCALLARRIPVNVWGRLIRRKLYVDNNIVVERGVNMSEDFNVMPRLTFWANKVAYVDDVLFCYNCLNENSYTNNFNESKFDQIWQSVDVLEDFFQNRGTIYQDALNCGKMKCISISLFELGKAGGHYDYFKKMKEKQYALGGGCFSHMGIIERLLMKINNYTVFRFCLNCCVCIKRFFKKNNLIRTNI